MITKNKIPIHNINSEFNIKIEDIPHINPYNYKEMHRHNYYEFMFFTKGGGYQFIDFDKIFLKNNSCYIVKPRQVHLVKRNKEADGFLIQFKTTALPTELINSLQILQCHSEPKILFENKKNFIEKISSYVNLMKNTNESEPFYDQKLRHLLTVILYDLEAFLPENKNFNLKKEKILFDFNTLVNSQKNKLTVNEYAEKLNISTKKLNEIVKKNYGITPLQYIHNNLLLEIKRELIFKDVNIKEVSYSYGFDNPSNFSLFIKKKTGFTPTELQRRLTNL
ncbi:helix-turn-helix domain-containing protein [Tenacibaculum sp. 190524A02b]|uniref:helix-turn-helix domain-containing protein n=1 Tax=Tenacibaculum vairaonense TaxID=3137860 RepID=UPI0031FA6AAA